MFHEDMVWFLKILYALTSGLSMNVKGSQFTDPANNFFNDEQKENKKLLAMNTPAGKQYSFLPPNLEKLCKLHHLIINGECSFIFPIKTSMCLHSQ